MRTSWLRLALLAALMLSACGGKSGNAFVPTDDVPDDAATFDVPSFDVPSFDVPSPDVPTPDVASPDASAPDVIALDASVDRPVATDASVDRPTTTDASTDDATTSDTPATGTCSARALPSRVGSAIATGDTSSSENVLSGTCGGDEAPEAAFTWMAPAAGTYTITTAGSAYDTVLYVLDGACDGEELDCNDDDPDGKGVTSSVTVTLRAGQTVVIVVDGYGGDSGAFTLNITGG